MITDTWLKASKGKPLEKVEETADRDGLSVRISRKGKVVFQMRFSFGGKPCRLDLGTYPRMCLKDARDENERLRGLLENEGKDPRVVRFTEKANTLAAQADTLSVLWGDFYRKVVSKRAKQHAQINRNFEMHVLPQFGRLPARDVILEMWMDLLEELAVSVPGVAERVLTYARRMSKWAVRRGRLSVNPLAEITRGEDLQLFRKRANRSLNEEELTRVWLAIDRSHLRPPNKLYLKLDIIYGCRLTELTRAKKSDFDFVTMVWTVPAENHKTGEKTKQPLLRPITPEIEPLIREAIAWAPEGELLFPVKCGTKMKSPTSQLCFPINLRRWLKKKEGYEMAVWSVKAFRKTARTNFSTLTMPHIAEIMLGHALPGSWGIYDQHKYLGEQAQAYSGWCQRILSLTGCRSLIGYEQWPRVPTFKPKTVVDIGHWLERKKALQRVSASQVPLTNSDQAPLAA